MWLLPPVAFGCSHEHTNLGVTVSVSAATLHAVVTVTIAKALSQAGRSLVVVNGRGGNCTRSNGSRGDRVSGGPRCVPIRAGWVEGQATLRLVRLLDDEDMHAGEMETSLLLHAMPDVVNGPSYQSADRPSPDCPMLTTLAMRGMHWAEPLGPRRRQPLQRAS